MEKKSLVLPPVSREAPAARPTISQMKECGEKVSMRSLNPHCGAATSIVKLIANVYVGMRGQIERAENDKSVTLPAP